MGRNGAREQSDGLNPAVLYWRLNSSCTAGASRMLPEMEVFEGQLLQCIKSMGFLLLLGQVKCLVMHSGHVCTTTQKSWRQTCVYFSKVN